MVLDGALDAVGLADLHRRIGSGLPDDAVALLVVEDEHGGGAVSGFVGVDVLDSEGQDNPISNLGDPLADGAGSSGGQCSLGSRLSLLDRIDPDLGSVGDQTHIAERLGQDGNPAVVLELGEVVLLHPEVQDQFLHGFLAVGGLQPLGALLVGSVVSGPFLGVSKAAEGAGQIGGVVGGALALVLLGLLLGHETLGGSDPSGGGDERSRVVVVALAVTAVVGIQDGVDVVGGGEDLRNVHAEVEVNTGVTDLLLGASGVQDDPGALAVALEAAVLALDGGSAVSIEIALVAADAGDHVKPFDVLDTSHNLGASDANQFLGDSDLSVIDHVLDFHATFGGGADLTGGHGGDDQGGQAHLHQGLVGLGDQFVHAGLRAEGEGHGLISSTFIIRRFRRFCVEFCFCLELQFQLQIPGISAL